MSTVMTDEMRIQIRKDVDEAVADIKETLADEINRLEAVKDEMARENTRLKSALFERDSFREHAIYLAHVAQSGFMWSRHYVGQDIYNAAVSVLNKAGGPKPSSHLAEFLHNTETKTKDY